MDLAAPPEDRLRFRFEVLTEAIPRQGLIERRRSVDLIADQQSYIDSHCAGQEQVIWTFLRETQTDLSVRIESNDVCFHPVGSHWTLEPQR